MSAHRNILVAVGPLVERSAALECATSLALRDGARLTVLSAVGSPSPFVWLVPGLPENPLHGLQRACEQRLLSLARAMPPDLTITTQMRFGNPIPALLDELRHGSYDLVVIGGDQHRRWRWRSRLSRALLRRCGTSILVVAPAGGSLPAGARSLAPRTADVVTEGA